MLLSCSFTAFWVGLSDTAGDGPIQAGMAGLRHKPRHKQCRPIGRRLGSYNDFAEVALPWIANGCSKPR